jgi:hypothetical protein
MEKIIINSSIHNWVNNNKELLVSFKGKWIAHDEEKVLASAKTGAELVSIIKQNNLESYVLAYIHPTWFSRPARFLPLHFKSLKTHEWTPNYRVKLDSGIKEHIVEMLVDSGADLSLIPFWLGELLGLSVSLGEPLIEAFGVGGSTFYVVRNLSFTIDGHTIHNVRTAWVQDDKIEDLLLGRDSVFDAFDVEFKQAEELILFKKRNTKQEPNPIPLPSIKPI